MKNLLSFDINGDNALDSNPFVLRRTDPEFIKKQDEAYNSFDETQKTPSSEKLLRTVRVVCGYVFLVALICIFEALADVGTATFSDAPWITALGVFCGLVFIILSITTKRKVKAITESDDFKEYEEITNKITEESYDFLGVPPSAKNVDAFVRFYKIKNGKEKNSTSLFEFINMEYKIFREENSLCLADTETVFAIPLENITDIQKMNRRVKFFGWNKEEGYRGENYKPYKIKADGFALAVKTCCSLRFHSDFGEEYEILFPAYELDTFTSLTGLEVKEDY